MIPSLTLASASAANSLLASSSCDSDAVQITAKWTNSKITWVSVRVCWSEGASWILKRGVSVSGWRTVAKQQWLLRGGGESADGGGSGFQSVMKSEGLPQCLCVCARVCVCVCMILGFISVALKIVIFSSWKPQISINVFLWKCQSVCIQNAVCDWWQH